MNNGTVIEWKLGSKIGDQSGFGQVFEAEKFVDNTKLDGEYVVKKLTQLDTDSIARFKREVRYLTKLDHPRIVKNEGYALQQEPYFYAMTKYKTSLISILPELASDYNRLQLIFNNILEGLDYLHNEGYYHRDLKPANVLYNSDHDLVLCDLGLCINSNFDETTRLTATYMAIGTRYYCSPEQETDLKSVDQRTDIYSVGKMIYEAFTGTRPLILDINQLPAAIQFVINKSTKEKREKRFDSVAELRQHFNTAMELLINDISKDDLLSIINEVNQLDKIAGKEQIIDKLAHLLNNLRGKEEFQETFMKISTTSFKFLENKYLELSKELVEEFINTINSQGWPFSYTDTLANKCGEIFNNIQDIDSRGDILKGLLELGTTHNRWHVMHKFIELLTEVKTEIDAHSIYHILISEDYYLKRLSNSISFDEKDLHPIIRKLFVFNN